MLKTKKNILAACWVWVKECKKALASFRSVFYLICSYNLLIIFTVNNTIKDTTQLKKNFIIPIFVIVDIEGSIKKLWEKCSLFSILVPTD